MDSVVHPGVQVGSWLPALVESCEPPRPFPPNLMATVPSLCLHNLAQISDCIHTPETRRETVHALYHEMVADVPKLSQFLAQLAACTPSTPPVQLACFRLQQTYDTLVGLAVLFNRILRVFEPDSLTLKKEAAAYCDALIDRARQAAVHRPLGANYFPVCLVTAWVAAVDSTSKAAIEELMATYDLFCVQAQWIIYAKWLESKLNGARLRMSTASSSPGSPGHLEPPITPVEEVLDKQARAGGSCCIL